MKNDCFGFGSRNYYTPVSSLRRCISIKSRKVSMSLYNNIFLTIDNNIVYVYVYVYTLII